MTQRITLFRAYGSSTGSELWVTDGTADGTSLVKDINSGPGSSYPYHITALGNGKALFNAYDGSTGRELWVTDGTTAGTSLVKDIRPGTSSSSPYYLTSIGNGKALFRAYDGSTGNELWVTDGTTAGTSLVQDIRPGTSGSYPYRLTSLGTGRALFTAQDSSTGRELWVTDGTSAGTSMIKDINPGTSSSSPFSFTPMGDGKVLFSASNGSSGTELWVTDGTGSGTSMVKDINAGASSSSPSYMTVLGNGQVLFSASSSSTGRELWVTDGTGSGTSLLADINTGSSSSSPSSITALGSGKALFSASNSSTGRELWITDGTAAGTSLVKDINAGTTSSSPSYMTVLGSGKALFSASNTSTGRELWVTDGTAAGTSLVKDIRPGTGSASPYSLSALGNGTALFRAYDGSTGSELWVTDGTAAGTSLVKDINPASANSSPSNLVTFEAADTAAPAAPIISSVSDNVGSVQGALADGAQTDDPTLTVTGTGEAGATIKVFNGATQLGTTTADGTGNWSITTSTLSDGVVSLTATATDAVGNTSGASSGFTVTVDTAVPCFCAGTRILTPSGEVPVEHLRAGDQVVTLSGMQKTIAWVGSGRTLVTPRNRCDVFPVIVRTGAIADQVPHRDLHLTRRHGLLIGDVLVPVEHLINGTSVVWDETTQIIEYYHVELQDHDILVANGAPAESFRDDDSVLLFQNAALRPEYLNRVPSCAPVVNKGEALQQAWSAVASRLATSAEVTTSHDPDLHLLINGKRISPTGSSDGACCFDIPAPTDDVSIISRTCIPEALNLSTDRRRLGVALFKIVLKGNGLRVEITPAAACLDNGTYPAEDTHRWTKGQATMNASLFSSFDGPVSIEVHYGTGDLVYRQTVVDHRVGAASQGLAIHTGQRIIGQAAA